MSKKERIVTGVNHQAIRVAKTEATNYLVLLNRAKDSLKQLTDGNVTELNIDLVDSYLNGLTGFKNGSLSAMAYNLQSEYNELKTLIEEVDKGVGNLQYITKDKVDEAKIQDANTTYLRDKYTEEYLRIKEAVDLLNKSSMYVINGSVAFGRDEVLFDANKFQGAKVMGGR